MPSGRESAEVNSGLCTCQSSALLLSYALSRTLLFVCARVREVEPRAFTLSCIPALFHFYLRQVLAKSPVLASNFWPSRLSLQVQGFQARSTSPGLVSLLQSSGRSRHGRLIPALEQGFPHLQLLCYYHAVKVTFELAV